MATKKGGRKAGRDARTGRFISVREAQRRKGTAVVETLPAPRPKRRKKS